jgi:glycosyltransferase involved in cell wall biosynthesis
MLLTFVVLSYNRPDKLERILSHFSGFNEKSVAIVVKDDNSPFLSSIEKIVNKYKGSIGIPLSLQKNESNLGYDGNLLDAFEKIESEYIFLLSDDDYVKVEELSELITMLKKREHYIYFTPYNDIEGEWRIVNPVYSLTQIADVIYNSVLFSGLIFNKNAVMDLEFNKDYLSQSIYSQVYLATMIALKYDAYGAAPSGILFVGGDGENFFGKNQSAVNSDILSDRTQITSNLNYQQFLLKVVDKISVDSGYQISKYFWASYSKRLMGYGFKARALGLLEYKIFLFSYFEPGVKKSLFISFLFACLILMPSKLANIIYKVGKSFLRTSG